MRRDPLRVNRGNEHAGIGYTCRIPTVAAYDPKDARAYRSGIVQRGHDIRAYVSLDASAPHRENQNRIPPLQMADAQPRREDGRPAFVIDASGQFRDIVGRRVALNSSKFAEIVYRMGSIGGTAADAKYEQAAGTLANSNQRSHHLFDGCRIQLPCNFFNLSEKGDCKP